MIDALAFAILIGGQFLAIIVHQVLEALSPMTLADYSLTAFALLNGARVAGYVPQMLRICRDPYGAAAVSVTTWILFAAANIATVAYALTGPGDLVVAGVFTLNGLGCLVIVG